MKKDNKFRGISLIAIFIGLVMLFCAGGFILYNYQEKILVREKHNDLIAISQLKVEQIVNWRNERLGDANSIFNNTLAIDAIHHMIAGTRRDENYKKLSEWLLSIQTSYHYNAVLLFDTTLQILIQSKPAEPLGEIGKLLAIKAMTEKKIIFTDLHKTATSDPHLGIIIPLFTSPSDTNGLTGVIYLRIDASKFLFPLLQNWPTPSRTSEALLIRKEGNNVVYLNELRHKENTALNLSFPLTDTLLPATKAALGITGIVEGLDYRGKIVLANIEKIPGTTWIMITKIDADEIFYAIREQALWIFSVTLLLILVGALITYFLWRRHSLKAQIERMALLRHFDNFFKYASDAIILTDATGKITQVNEKAVSIYGYSADEFMELNFRNLVLPGTINQVEDVLNLYKKSAEGAIFETRHIRKNGEIFHVEISSRNIHINDSDFFQAIIRDITERKSAQETILLNDARISGLLRLSQYQPHTIQEFLDYALEEAIKLTQSKIGYIYFYDEEKQEFTLNSWSGKVLEECSIVDPQTTYQLEKTGIWGEAVRQRRPILVNDFQMPNPLKKGYPDGHAPLHKYLTIPVLIENRIVAVVAVANKETDYTDADIQQLTLMMDTVWRITEQKRADSELIKNRRFLSDLIENSGTIIYAKDREGRYMLVNRKWEEVTNINREFALNKTDKELFPGERGKQFYLDDQKALESGILSEKEEVLDDSSGIRYFISIKFPLFDENNLISGICVISMDITGRKQAEESIIKLNENLEKTIAVRTAELSDLYNNAPCGYHSLDTAGVFELINDTELKWLGYEREEIIGKLNFGDIITNESKKTFQKNFPVFKSQGWIHDIEYDLLRKDGSVLPVLLTATAIYDQDGNYLRSRSTIIDHTHRKKTAELLREAHHKLENTNKELEAFAYSVSHDLRAPLRGIDGWSLALLDDFGHLLDEKAHQYLDRVRSETQRMGQLIDDMLKLSRVTRTDMKNEPVAISELVTTICSRLTEANPQRKLQFTIQPGLTVAGDHQLLEIALTNLLDNAVKFTGMREVSIIEFGTTFIGDELNYYIRDNGVGFDMNYSKKLFGAFQRMHKQTDFPGTGIGLATVQRIIHRHSGHIRVEAKVDEGAVFYFTIGKKA